MRRILVDSARRKQQVKHGGLLERIDLDKVQLAVDSPGEDLLAIDEALEQLEAADEQAAALAKLRYFAGMTVEEAAELLGIPARTAYRNWSFARAWIYRHVADVDACDERNSK